MNIHSSSTVEQDIRYYIQYISSWFYYNVLNTDTTVVLLKFIVFVILLSLVVYQKYHYFAVGVILIICATLYMYLQEDGNDMGINDWMDTLNPEGKLNAPRRVDRDELTFGIPLVKEGFSIGMPKIIMGDDSGKDHRRSNKFIEEDSREFTEKYFKSKQCGIGSGIGGITMFGSNELIGGERLAVLSGLYNYEAYYVENTTGGVNDDSITAKRYTYFKDCVYYPVRRSVDNQNGQDFRTTKKNIYTNINNNIINIDSVLKRFNKNVLFITYNDPSSDFNKRISLSSLDKDGKAIPNNVVSYESLIEGGDNNTKLENIQSLTYSDNINDRMYTELLARINKDTTITSIVKQYHIEVYAKVHDFRKRLDSILANMREQTKNDASLLYTVRISESVIQEIRMILSYLNIVKTTNDIIMFEEKNGTDKNGIYNMIQSAINVAPPGGSGSLGVIDDSAVNDDNNKPYKSAITGENNIFKIPIEDDTYNNKDEKRYLYGITYYFDKSNSTPLDNNL